MVKGVVKGQKIQIMIDTGASSSYVCSSLIAKLNLTAAHKENRCIEQIFDTITKIVEIYRIKIESSVTNEFSLDIRCINGERDVLTYLPNSQFQKLKGKYKRLERIRFCDEDSSKDQLSIHIILVAADYHRIRSAELPVLGENPDTDPGAEYTMFSWILYGKSILTEEDIDRGFLAKFGQKDFEKLCSLDVFGLINNADKSNIEFHADFKEQLQLKKDGFYEIRFPWKPSRPDLPTNKEIAISRLKTITRKLERINKLQEYDIIMQEQIQEGIIEEVPPKTIDEVLYYVPHHPVICEEAESTHLHIVYDCSAKGNCDLPSLNDCLETGHSLQPLLFDILLRNRMRHYCITGDIKKAFLQIRISK